MKQIADVPRGTRLRGLRFSEPMAMSIRGGWKDETRRVMGRGNSRLTRGAFADLDLTSGRPDRRWPVSSLRCRIATSATDRRSVTVTPLILPNSMVWPRRGQSGAEARRANATHVLKIIEVSCGRLCDISEDSAWREGIAVFAPSAPRVMAEAIDPVGHRRAYAAQAYEFLLGQLGRNLYARWMRGPVHQEIVGRGPSGRDCFALLWEWIGGSGSWQANPWVWCYRFETMHLGSSRLDPDRFQQFRGFD